MRDPVDITYEGQDPVVLESLVWDGTRFRVGFSMSAPYGQSELLGELDPETGEISSAVSFASLGADFDVLMVDESGQLYHGDGVTNDGGATWSNRLYRVTVEPAPQLEYLGELVASGFPSVVPVEVSEGHLTAVAEGAAVIRMDLATLAEETRVLRCPMYSTGDMPRLRRGPSREIASPPAAYSVDRDTDQIFRIRVCDGSSEPVGSIGHDVRGNTAIAYRAGTLYISSARTDAYPYTDGFDLLTVSPETGELLAPPVPITRDGADVGLVESLAWSEDTLLVGYTTAYPATGGSRLLGELDPETGAISNSVGYGVDFDSLGVDRAGDLYSLDGVTNATYLYRIDRATSSLTAVGNAYPRSGKMAFLGGHLFLLSDGSTLSQHDRHTVDLLQTIDLDPGFSTGSTPFVFALEHPFPPPPDTAPPVVEITSPPDGTVVGVEPLAVAVTVTDESSSNVTSAPPGIDESLPPGGGSVVGSISLDGDDGERVVTITAQDEHGNTGFAEVTVVRDTSPPIVSVLAPVAGSTVSTSIVHVRIEVLDVTAVHVSFGENEIDLDPGETIAEGDVVLSVEGPQQIPVVATDAAGNETTAHIALTLDLQAPILTIDDPADGAFFGPGESPVAVAVTVDDISAATVASTPSGVSGATPPGGGQVTGTILLSEGANPIAVTVTDAAGRQATETIVVHLDTAAPVVTISTPVDGGLVRGTVDVSVTAEDPSPGSGVSQVVLFVDGVPHGSSDAEPHVLSLDTTLLPDGSHTIAAQATDQEGNTGLAAPISINVDNTAPEITITNPATGSYIGGDPVEVMATIEDGNPFTVSSTPTGVEGSFPPGVSATSGFVIVTVEGESSLVVSAIDAAGNVGTDTLTVIRDTAPPIVSFTLPEDAAFVGGAHVEISVAAFDPDFGSGLTELRLFLDGSGLTSSSGSPLTWTLDSTALSDGVHVLTAEADDLTRNTGTSSISITVDNTRPS